MDFYNCPYVVVIPFRSGNEYDEDYGCEATGKSCQCCQCKLTPVECEQLFRNRKLTFFGRTGKGAEMKYRCIEPFAVDCYDDRGMPTEGRVEIVCGSIWERDDETDIIGAGVHLDNVETMEWLEIPERELEEYFEPLN